MTEHLLSQPYLMANDLTEVHGTRDFLELDTHTER